MCVCVFDSSFGGYQLLLDLIENPLGPTEPHDMPLIKSGCIHSLLLNPITLRKSNVTIENTPCLKYANVHFVRVFFPASHI